MTSPISSNAMAWRNSRKAGASSANPSRPSCGAPATRHDAGLFFQHRDGQELSVGRPVAGARRGWETVGVDNVPAAIEAATANGEGVAGLSYLVGDVTRLAAEGLGTFDFFLDIGCFQCLDAGQQLAEGQEVTAMANPGATVLLLTFGPSRWRPLVGGAAQGEVQAAFAGWEMLTAEPAETAGLGWPMNKTAPRWYRMVRRS